MTNFTKDLGEYASKLCQTTTFDEAFEIFDQQVKKLGFKSALYTYIPKIILEEYYPESPVFKVSDTFEHAFLEHYLDAHLDQYDYTIRQLIEGKMDTIDWTNAANNQKMSTQEKQLFDLAGNDYHMRNALTIPLLSDHRGIAAASFISDENDRHFSLLKKETFDVLHTCTTLFHNHAMGNAFDYTYFVRPLLDNLNETELAVLRSLPKGLPVSCIGNDVGKSARYIDKVIRNLRSKIGGVNDKQQPNISTGRLIYYIGLMGLGDS